MPVVDSTAILFEAGMMIRSKPGWTVLVAATIFLTTVGPLPGWQPVLLSTGMLSLMRLSLFVCRLSPGLPLLLLFLFGRPGCMLFRRFGFLLVLLGFGSLILLSVRGS